MTQRISETENNHVRFTGPSFGREDLDWQDDAACADFYAQTGYDAWFGPNEDEQERAAAEAAAVCLDEGGTQAQAESMAKAAVHELWREARSVAEPICRSCPVQTECLTFAIQHEQTDGIWAGLTPYGRTALVRRVRERNVA